NGGECTRRRLQFSRDLLAAAALAATLALAARRTLGRELLLGLALGARQLLAGRLIDDLHGEPHLAAVVEAPKLGGNFLAFVDHFANRLRTALRQLRDVNQAVLGTEEVHERAELHDLDDLALVDRADLGLGRDAADACQRLLDALAIGGRDLHRAVVV